ncbi:MAG: hypothetical protein P4L41_07415 [Flavipsychrobacter sp.]|nr:hypothetical protein [Flavipsychrobacter sp.]
MDKMIAKLGFYSALAACIAATGFSVAQILQVLGFVVYPLDVILINGFSLCIAPPFLIAMVALHYSILPEKKFWSHVALLFATIYVVYVTLNYVVQFVVVMPKPVNDSSVAILAVSPQSLFWTIDGLGYIFMGLSTLFAAFVFVNEGLQKWVRWFFIANGLLVPVISVVYFYPHFSIALLFLAFPWVITVPDSMLLLTLFFKSNMHSQVIITSNSVVH